MYMIDGKKFKVILNKKAHVTNLDSLSGKFDIFYNIWEYFAILAGISVKWNRGNYFNVILCTVMT